jgi:two-component system phosphate regulon sensor histidine kinase PhoR
MNKKIITGLVILMGFSLLGIVAVQVYWFNNSVNVKNELFDRSVNDAMNKAVRRLETGHDLKVIRNIVNGDTILSTTGRHMQIPPPPPPPIPGLENLNVVIKRDSIHRIIRVMTSNSKNLKGSNHTYKIDSQNGKNNNSVTLLTEDYFGGKSDSLIKLDLSGYKTRVDQKLKQLKSLTNQIQIEYKGWETGRHIDENQLKNLLKEELLDKAIPIDFEMVISGGDSIQNRSFKSGGQRKLYKVNLFPDDIFRKNLELAVFFPQRNIFIGRTTSQLLGLSVVFTLIIFLTFSLSIYLIIRQKKISEMKSDFINNMTHEFKTPIATISIAADSISNEKVINEGDKVRFFAGMIKKENMRMNEQVERILQIARLDRKEFEFNFKATDIHLLIEEAVSGILLQLEQRGGKIETNLEAVNPVVTTDPTHFTNLVYNLLDNAIKYSPDAPIVKVRTTNSAKGVFLTVEDHGMGMSKAVQSRIFDKFYRLPSGNIHNIKGFGLGLSYVKAILEANNGSIKVHSEPGKGSRFIVFIPFLINQR